MIELLVTRHLTDEQRNLLPLDRFHIEEYNALEIEYLPTDLDSDDEAICIFTSKHAIAACFPEGNRPERMLNCCCVGEKTAARMEAMGHRILEVQKSAEELANRIIDKYAGRSFIYFCGSLRLDTLPDRLRESGVRLEERVVYRTGLNEAYYDHPFDGVLFFSPSGVRSFLSTNQLNGARPICIGPTTARELQKHTDEFIIADAPTVEDVLQAAYKLLPGRPNSPEYLP